MWCYVLWICCFGTHHCYHCSVSVKDIRRMFSGKSKIETFEQSFARFTEAERLYRMGVKDARMRQLKYRSTHEVRDTKR